jgi:hypothetical protein
MLKRKESASQGEIFSKQQQQAQARPLWPEPNREKQRRPNS